MDEATLEGLICPPKVSQVLRGFAPSLPEADQETLREKLLNSLAC